MKRRDATFYVPTAPHTEIEIMVTARDYNGIDSDPRVVLREPTFEELNKARQGLLRGLMTLVPEFDFPVQEMRDPDSFSSPSTFNPQHSTMFP